MRFPTLRVLFCGVMTAMAVVPVAAQERREVERHVVIAGPFRLEQALAEREELQLSEEQVRRLEAIRADAERQAEAVLNEEQKAELNRLRERHDALGRRLRVHRGPRAMPPRAEYEVCERPADAEPEDETCRIIRFRGGMPPVLMPGLLGPHAPTMPGMEECETDEQGNERCTVRRFRLRREPGKAMPEGTECERRRDEQGREIATCRREVTVR